MLAAGVATLILGTGALRALTDTRDRYYADYRFADLSSDVVRAPLGLLADIRQINGVVAVEPRILKPGRPEIEGMVEPASVFVVTLPQ